MQRVRIGLTGLGFVFVAVLLAMALTGSPETDAPVDSNGAAVVAEESEQPKDPFSEQGLAPGNADRNLTESKVSPDQPSK